PAHRRQRRSKSTRRRGETAGLHDRYERRHRFEAIHFTLPCTGIVISINTGYRDKLKWPRLRASTQRRTTSKRNATRRNTAMSRITTPASIEAAPAAASPLLEAVKKQIGSVPNRFRVVANSPAALEGYLGLNGALAK